MIYIAAWCVRARWYIGCDGCDDTVGGTVCRVEATVGDGGWRSFFFLYTVDDTVQNAVDGPVHVTADYAFGDAVSMIAIDDMTVLHMVYLMFRYIDVSSALCALRTLVTPCFLC